MGLLAALGWKTGFEPATLGTTNRCSNQLSYNHHLEAVAKVIFFAQCIKIKQSIFYYLEVNSFTDPISNATKTIHIL